MIGWLAVGGSEPAGPVAPGKQSGRAGGHLFSLERSLLAQGAARESQHLYKMTASGLQLPAHDLEGSSASWSEHWV